MRQPPPNPYRKSLRKEAGFRPARGSTPSSGSGPTGLAVRRGVDRGRQKHLPTSWSKGLVANRGISTACRGVRRDSSSTPRESGCDLGRKSPRAKRAAETDSPRPATTPALPDPQQPRQRRRRRRQERRSLEGPGRGACRESGCPGIRLSRTCPELAPQKPAQPQSPLRPDPLWLAPGNSGRDACLSWLGLGPEPPEDGVLQACRRRLTSSSVNQRLSRKKRGRVWVERNPLFPRAPLVVTSLWSLGRRMETPFLIWVKGVMSSGRCPRWQEACSGKVMWAGGLARIPKRGVSGARLLAEAGAALASSSESPKACLEALSKALLAGRWQLLAVWSAGC